VVNRISSPNRHISIAYLRICSFQRPVLGLSRPDSKPT